VRQVGVVDETNDDEFKPMLVRCAAAAASRLRL
jgi:hypothetical protein